MTGEERKIIGVTTAAHGLNHGFILVFSAVLPMLRKDFNTNYFHLGLIGNVCFFAFGLGSLPFDLLLHMLNNGLTISGILPSLFHTEENDVKTIIDDDLLYFQRRRFFVCPSSG